MIECGYALGSSSSARYAFDFIFVENLCDVSFQDLLPLVVDVEEKWW